MINKYIYDKEFNRLSVRLMFFTVEHISNGSVAIGLVYIALVLVKFSLACYWTKTIPSMC